MLICLGHIDHRTIHIKSYSVITTLCLGIVFVQSLPVTVLSVKRCDILELINACIGMLFGKFYVELLQ